MRQRPTAPNRARGLTFGLVWSTVVDVGKILSLEYRDGYPAGGEYRACWISPEQNNAACGHRRAYDMPAIQSKSSVAPAALAPAVFSDRLSERFSEILTIDELANFLKCSRRSVYNLTRKRAQASTNPCPVLRTPVGIRFLRTAVEAWLQRCVN